MRGAVSIRRAVSERGAVTKIGLKKRRGHKYLESCLCAVLDLSQDPNTQTPPQILQLL